MRRKLCDFRRGRRAGEVARRRRPAGRLARAAALAVVLSLALRPLLHAAPPAQEVPLPPRLDEGVGRGLEFLARQQAADGSFDGGGPKLAMTGLSLMAFLACGHTPDVGRYGLVVRGAVDFLVKQVPEDGYAGKVDNSRMYGQGIVALALAESYGAEQDPDRRREIRPALARAVGVILAAQAVQKPAVYAGGWRYTPEQADSDISLAGWNALALRAAQNVGLNVPKESVQRAVEFIARCATPAGDGKNFRGFGYQPGGAPADATTGVGVLSLYLLDAAERPEVAGGVKFLVERPIDPAGQHPYYTAYYVTQAAFQAGGGAWPAVSKQVLERLIAAQQADDGGWPQSTSAQEPGRVYATAMAVLTLSVPYALLPTYQR